MFKRLLIAAIFSLLPSFAWAQGNPQCPTRPIGDNTNACASTAFVQQNQTTITGLTPNLPVIGSAGGGIAQGTRSGNTTSFGTSSGTLTNGHCVSIDSNGNFVDAGGACTVGGGGGTVTSGTAGQYSYYASTGTTVSGISVPATATQYVSCGGNDSLSGNSPAFSKLTIASAMTALGATGGTINVGGNCTYNLTAAIQYQPGVLINCAQGAVISQANAQGLSELIDFHTNSANGAGMQNCTVDGNVAGQSLSCSGFMVNIGPANDVFLFHNIFRNAVCTAIQVTTGLRPIIVNNTLNGYGYDGIGFYNTSAQQPTHGLIQGNTVLNPGAHFIEIYDSDFINILGNTYVGNLITGITATVTGASTVTWVAGPTFTGARAGNFVVCNGSAGYQELLITAVTSSTSLAISTAGTAGSSQSCVVGPGDIIDLGGSFTNISDNNMQAATTGGVVVNNFPAGGSAPETIQQNHVSNNIIYNVGGGCIFVDAESNGGAIMIDNSYTSNQLRDCAQAGGASFNSAHAAAIIIDDTAPTGVLNQWVDGNIIIDTGGTLTKYWMSMIGAIVQTEAQIGKNTSRGMVNVGISNGIRSTPTLAAGWGSSASITSYWTNGDSYSISINATGTGQSQNPNITINKAVSQAEVTPIPVCAISSSTGTSTTINISSTTINQDVLVFNGTPTASAAYTIRCK